MPSAIKILNLLRQLNDVAVISPTNGQVLTYNSSLGKWENKDSTGGSGGGTSGYSGPSGFSGYSGPSGYSGYSGRSGYSGSIGFSGYSGYIGVSGYSGYSANLNEAVLIAPSSPTRNTITPTSNDTSSLIIKQSPNSGDFSYDILRVDKIGDVSQLQLEVNDVNETTWRFSASNPVQFRDGIGFSLYNSGNTGTVSIYPQAGTYSSSFSPPTSGGVNGQFLRTDGFGNTSWADGGSGFSGYSGKSGYSGFSGYIGPQGSSGFSGYSAYSGISGFSGYSAYSGISGFSGYKGSDGIIGVDGASGFSGYSGRSGYSAYSGISGFSGYSGPSGFSGYSGPSGFSGYSGPSGFSGYSAYSGVSGFSGYSAYSGRSGYSAYSGFSGFSGYSAFSGYSGAAATPGVASYIELVDTTDGVSGWVYDGSGDWDSLSGLTLSSQVGFTNSAGQAIAGSDGAYLVNASLSFNSAITAVNFNFSVFVNGIQSNIVTRTTTTDPNTGIFSVSLTGVLSLSATDTVDIRIKNMINTDVITLLRANFCITAICGDSGFSGYSGLSGFSGYSAYSGISGFSGYSAYSGRSGYSAYSGFSGYIGTQGSSGFSGYSAYSGYSGALSLTAVPGSDVTANGLIISLTAGENLAFGDVVYLKSDGLVWKADADGSATYPCMGMATATITSSNAGNILLHGIARNDAWAWTVGGIVYLSTTAGALTQTQPSATDNVIQVLGIATHADRMYFFPDLTYITHT
jgi:hypothetical protein